MVLYYEIKIETLFVQCSIRSVSDKESEVYCLPEPPDEKCERKPTYAV